jgi:hypothetical protein
MGDIQMKTFVNNDGYTVTGNTAAGEDLRRNSADEGIMRSKTSSGDIGFVGNSDSLIIGGRDFYRLSVDAPIAAENKPSGMK